MENDQEAQENASQDAGPQDGAGPAKQIAQGNMDPEAFYDKLRVAQGKIDVVQNVLGKLMTMGDMLTQEDVIKGASKIVAAGVSPEGMASILADMPDKQEFLPAWVAEHKATFDKQEQQIAQLAASVRHEMGVNALKGVLGSAQQAQAPEPPMDAGALAPSAPAAVAPSDNSLME